MKKIIAAIMAVFIGLGTGFAPETFDVTKVNASAGYTDSEGVTHYIPPAPSGEIIEVGRLASPGAYYQTYCEPGLCYDYRIIMKKDFAKAETGWIDRDGDSEYIYSSNAFTAEPIWLHYAVVQVPVPAGVPKNMVNTCAVDPFYQPTLQSKRYTGWERRVVCTMGRDDGNYNNVTWWFCGRDCKGLFTPNNPNPLYPNQDNCKVGPAAYPNIPRCDNPNDNYTGITIGDNGMRIYDNIYEAAKANKIVMIKSVSLSGGAKGSAEYTFNADFSMKKKRIISASSTKTTNYDSYKIKNPLFDADKVDLRETVTDEVDLYGQHYLWWGWANYRKYWLDIRS